ncbi:MAG: hypothetical protein HY898_25675 [Deltaproteobacteria bacterium]|nr:hypothetical protein [Deltaproteobacteria bacterium]
MGPTKELLDATLGKARDALARIDSESAAMLPAERPEAALEQLATRDPVQAAALSLVIRKAMVAAWNDKGLELLRAEPMERLVAAARHDRAKHISVRSTPRPVPPHYRIEVTPLRNLVTTGQDVLSFVEQHGWHQAIWDECVFARGLNGLEAQQARFDSRKLDARSEAVGDAARKVLNSTLGYLPREELLEATRTGIAGFMDDTAAPLQERDDLQDPEVCLDLLERLVEYRTNDFGTFDVRDHRFGRVLIERLAQAKHAPAIPLLAALARAHTGYSGVKHDAVAALRSIGGRAVADAIALALHQSIADQVIAWDPHHPTLYAAPMVEAMLEVDDQDPYERLAPFFALDVRATETGAAVARDILIVLSGSVGPGAHAVVRLLNPDKPAAPAIGEDERFADLVVTLLGDIRLRPWARSILKGLDKKRVDAAIARVVGPTKPAKKAAPPDGEVIEVSDESARALMRDFRARLEAIAAKLKKAKYSPKAKGKAVRPADAAHASDALAQLEKLTKTPIPSMLKALYETVESVDFTADAGKPPPRGFEAFAAARPLIIQPLDRALRELKARLRDNSGIPPQLKDPLSLELCPGGKRVMVDAWQSDPVLEAETTTLSSYLQSAVDAWKLDAP